MRTPVFALAILVAPAPAIAGEFVCTSGKTLPNGVSIDRRKKYAVEASSEDDAWSGKSTKDTSLTMSGGFDIEAKDYVYVEILVKGGVVLKTFGYPCQLVKTFPEETITESVAPQAQNEDAPIEKEAPLQESAKPQVGEDADPLSERAFSLLSHFGIGRGK